MDILDIVQAWIDPVGYAHSKNDTSITVYANGKPIGAIQSLAISQRTVNNLSLKVLPQTQTNITANRIRFDRLRVSEAFDKGFVNGYSQKYPLSIRIDNVDSTSIIDNAWMKHCDYTYQTNEWCIVDSMKLEAGSINEEVVHTKSCVTQICKFCGQNINVYSIGGKFINGPNRCNFCQKYGFCVLPNGIVESEIVNIGNFFLIFIPEVQEANVVSVDDKDRKIMARFALSELTHETVIQWSNKLKTYVIFQ